MAKPMTINKHFDSIIEDIVNGESLNKSLKKRGCHFNAFYEYMKSSEELKDKYTKAREAQADNLFSELLDIADGKEVLVDSSEKVARNRLMVDTRKWFLSKVVPKIYGDKTYLGLGGVDSDTVKVQHAVDVESIKNLKDLIGV